MPENATQKNLIVITYPDSKTFTLDAKKGDWTDYRYDGAAFIVLCGNAIVGLYNFQHVRSIEVMSGAVETKEATPNG